MGQVSLFLRKTDGGYSHWCLGCEEMHVIPNSWSFNGDVNKPTFSPSVKITGIQTVVKDGEWTGEWKRDAAGNTIPYCCHYILTDGIVNFCSDCTHPLANAKLPLPELPHHAKD